MPSKCSGGSDGGESPAFLCAAPSLFDSCEAGKGVGRDVSGGSMRNHLLKSSSSSQCQPNSASASLGCWLFTGEIDTEDGICVSLRASSLGHDLAQASLTSKPLFTGNGSTEKVSLAQGSLTAHSLCFLLCA